MRVTASNRPIVMHQAIVVEDDEPFNGSVTVFDGGLVVFDVTSANVLRADGTVDRHSGSVMNVILDDHLIDALVIALQRARPLADYAYEDDPADEDEDDELEDGDEVSVDNK